MEPQCHASSPRRDPAADKPGLRARAEIDKLLAILRKIAGGATEDVLLDAYLTLKKMGIKAAIVYAADTLAYGETLVAIGRK